MTERQEQNRESPTAEPQDGYPDPTTDWIDQRELADLFGICEKTACCWAKEGRLVEFEHGFPQCGRRKYSRTLIRRKLQRCWDRATQGQDDQDEQNENAS